MDDLFRELGLIVFGAVVGLAASLGTVFVQQRYEHQKRRKRTERLAQILYEEVEQICELLAIDLDPPSNAPLAMLLEEEHELPVRFRKAIDRLSSCNVLYLAYASELVELPDTLPGGLARFYNRLQVSVREMSAALEDMSLSEFATTRELIWIEAEGIKMDLKSAWQA